jgi:hypothetical protein
MALISRPGPSLSADVIRPPASQASGLQPTRIYPARFRLLAGGGERKSCRGLITCLAAS